jgi:RND superfamily putative drug exporter
MNRTLDRLGRFAATHPWRTFAVWLVIAVAVFGVAGTAGGQTQEDWDVPAAPAQAGVDLLREHLPQSGNTSAQVVVHDDVPLAESELTALTTRLAELDHVIAVTPPRMSADGDTALLTVQYDVPVTHRDVYGHAEPLEKAVEPTRDAGVEVVLGGELPSTAGSAMKGTGEIIGIVVALLILLLMFRSVVAAGLPIVVAVAGLAIGAAGITVLCGLMSVSPFAPTVATMVGLGVGIDYALLMLSRALEYRRAGFSVVDAAAAANVTAGRSVVLAGTTVLVSLLGLRLSGLATFAAFGFATAITVVAVMVTALLLVPAIFRLTHRWIEPRAVRRERKAAGRLARGLAPLDHRNSRAEGWARRVAGRPLPWLIGAATVMVLLAAPVLDMRTWPGSGGDEAPGSALRQSFDLIAEEYGPGANTPYLFVVDNQEAGTKAVGELTAALSARDDLVNVAPAVVSPDGEITLVTAESVLRDNDERVAGQIADLRADLPEGVELAGSSVMFSDIVDILADRIWLVIGFVVLISVLLLMVMFRSVVIPLKAAAMNLLSVLAAYGVLTAVFQWGWGQELLGLDHAMPVSTWLPILMFAILFGLSMDYEVFLLSRIREDYVRTGDARGSVARGLASTSRVITSAALIMVAVFLGFVTEEGVVIKMIGFGMAVAIFLDATVVRMVLVPATMSLLGDRNWWLPGWLDRILPKVEVEAPEPAPAATPTTGPAPDRELEPVG